MSFREVDRIPELDYTAQEVGTRAEAFDNAGDLLPAGAGAPEVISSGSFAGGFGIFDDFYFRGRLRRQGLDPCKFGLVVFVIIFRHAGPAEKSSQ